MPTQNSRVKAHRQKASAAFGRMCRRWRELNGWSQYTAELWAQAAGMPYLSHGGLSPLETGKTPNPRWQLFYHFAEMNRRLAVGDFSGVKDRSLLDRLKDAKPMRDDDGELLEEERLAGIHMGVRKVPASLWVPEPLDAPLLSDEDALALCETWRTLVRDECSRRGDRLMRCLDSLRSTVPSAHLLRLQDMVIGEITYTPEQLYELWEADHWLPATWIEAWIQGPKRLTPAGGGGVMLTSLGDPGPVHQHYLGGKVGGVGQWCRSHRQ